MKHLDAPTAKAYAAAAVERVKAALPEGWEVRAVNTSHGMVLRGTVVVIAPVGSTATLIVAGDARHMGSSWSSLYKPVLSLTLGDAEGLPLSGESGISRRYDVTSPEGEFNSKTFWKSANELLAKAVSITKLREERRDRTERNAQLAKTLTEALGVRVAVQNGWRADLSFSVEGSFEDLSALADRLLAQAEALRGKVNG